MDIWKDKTGKGKPRYSPNIPKIVWALPTFLSRYWIFVLDLPSEQEDEKKNSSSPAAVLEHSLDLPGLKIKPVPRNSHQIFILSSANPMKERVMALIRHSGLEPVESLEGDNAKKSLNQKYRDYPDVKFVIAILNNDDFVYPKDSKPQNASMQTQQRVILELGFWIGRLGRDNILTLYHPSKNFRRPTEFFDVLYIPFDEKDAWKTELSERLRQAGFNVKS